MDISGLTNTEFLDFAPREEILALLRGLDESGEDLEPLFTAIARRLGGKTYERSASAFLLIEIIYDFEEVVERELSYLLPRCVFVLTGDRDLALSALSAYNEIQDALKHQGPVVVEADSRADDREEEAEEPEDREPTLDDTVPIPGKPPERQSARADELLEELQVAQKRLADDGLSARVSLDLTARRPTPERQVRTREDITRLRESLERFESLIDGAELEVLGSADG